METRSGNGAMIGDHRGGAAEGYLGRGIAEGYCDRFMGYIGSWGFLAQGYLGPRGISVHGSRGHVAFKPFSFHGSFEERATCPDIFYC